MKKQTINGTGLAYVDQGTGPPVVLVHGFPLDHSMWSNQIEVLSASYRVIVPDLRGFGQSAPASGEKVTMEQFADDLAALADTLSVKEPLVLCGLSMGGYVAFAFWRKYAARLRALILCDTRATADTPEAARARLQVADQVVREGVPPLADTMRPKLFARTTVRQQPETLKALDRVMLALDPASVAAVNRGMAERRDMTAELSQIGCPTLVIVGQHDAISPPDEMRAIAERIPTAQLVEIPEAGHMTPMEKPAEVNAAILEFLA